MADYDTQRLTKLGRDHRRLTDRIAANREALATEIRAAADAGIPQVEIVRLTGYTREYIRRIVASRGED